MTYTFACLGVRQIAQSARPFSPAINAKRQARHFDHAPITSGLHICRRIQSRSALRIRANIGVARLFDHLVGAAEQRERDGEAERLGGLEVEPQPRA
jgi:hypothetical protein